MAVGEEMLAIWQRVGDPSMRPLTVRDQRRAQLKKFLSSYEWRDSHGQAIVAPPFNLRLAYSFSSNLSSTEFRGHTQAPINGAESEISAADDSQTLMWPPRNYGHILGLLNNLQMSHLFVVALSLQPPASRKHLISNATACSTNGTACRTQKVELLN